MEQDRYAVMEGNKIIWAQTKFVCEAIVDAAKEKHPDWYVRPLNVTLEELL